MIVDSGTRREFETGAVRDMAEGKGRCDLLPLDIVAELFPMDSNEQYIFLAIDEFRKTKDCDCLASALSWFSSLRAWDKETMLLELSKHFEEGSKKYGENNWQKGLPVSCYIDSAVRHLLKFLRGDTDENHDRAFVWNLMCCAWTVRNIGEEGLIE